MLYLTFYAKKENVLTLTAKLKDILINVINEKSLPYNSVWEACLMLRKIKKCLSVLLIVVLLPYIVTIFINGKSVEKQQKKDGKEELLKQHCIGILAREVSTEYEEEMLKVQALLVRTTVYQQIEEQGEKYTNQKDFGNVKDIEKSWYKKLEKIWDDTEGQVILYQGELALVPFHQVSNGKTRSGAEVLQSDEYPYLQIKECPKDVESKQQMESKFIEVKNAKVMEYDSAGYALVVKVGEETCNGEHFRNTYGLASSCFELQEFQENTRVITKGVGHGLGLSQYTANEMAKEGKKYKEILQYFFEGTEVQEVAEILWNIE